VFHNTRNTAAIHMIKAGAAEVEAMDIGGWKTRSIFEHYHITDETAKKRIAQRMAKAATQELTTLLTTGENNRPRFSAATANSMSHVMPQNVRYLESADENHSRVMAAHFCAESRWCPQILRCADEMVCGLTLAEC
jgi:hypothetical protein